MIGIGFQAGLSAALLSGPEKGVVGGFLGLQGAGWRQNSTETILWESPAGDRGTTRGDVVAEDAFFFVDVEFTQGCVEGRDGMSVGSGEDGTVWER